MVDRSTGRRLLASTWAGPFEAGPLVHPVTVGDALLKLLQLLWRIGVVIAISIALLAIAAGLYALLQPPPLSKQIVGSAHLDANRCGKEHPLLVAFTNSSSRTVQDIEFDFVAREAQRSSNLIMGPNYASTDAIIPAGKSVELCWSAPELKATSSPRAFIYYSVSVSSASESLSI